MVFGVTIACRSCRRFIVFKVTIVDILPLQESHQTILVECVWFFGGGCLGVNVWVIFGARNDCSRAASDIVVCMNGSQAFLRGVSACTWV